MAEGQHLFPFRTEKLSPPAPMVLPGKPGGRVGRCPIFSWWNEEPRPDGRGFFVSSPHIQVSGPVQCGRTVGAPRPEPPTDGPLPQAASPLPDNDLPCPPARSSPGMEA